jgi:hypothetical protein
MVDFNNSKHNLFRKPEESKIEEIPGEMDQKRSKNKFTGLVLAFGDGVAAEGFMKTNGICD